MMQLVQIEPKISIYGARFCSHGCFSIATLTSFDKRRRRHAMLSKWNATSTMPFLMFLGSIKSHKHRGYYGPSMEALRGPQANPWMVLFGAAVQRTRSTAVANRLMSDEERLAWLEPSEVELALINDMDEAFSEVPLDKKLRFLRARDHDCDKVCHIANK